MTDNELEDRRQAYVSLFPKRLHKYKSITEASREIRELTKTNKKLKQKLKSVRSTYRNTKSLLKGALLKQSPQVAHIPINPIFKSFNYVKYNKEALFNIKSQKKKPAADTKWLKEMRTSPRRTHSTARRWSRSPEFQQRSSGIIFKAIKEDTQIKPSYKYCRSCSERGQFILLKRWPSNT